MSSYIFHKTRPKLFLFTLLLGLISIYCAYHFTQGPRGYFALQNLEQHEKQLDSAIAELTAQRMQLEERVKKMRTSSIDPDLLEEQAMFLFGPRKASLIQIK